MTKTSKSPGSTSLTACSMQTFCLPLLPDTSESGSEPITMTSCPAASNCSRGAVYSPSSKSLAKGMPMRAIMQLPFLCQHLEMPHVVQQVCPSSSTGAWCPNHSFEGCHATATDSTHQSIHPHPIADATTRAVNQAKAPSSFRVCSVLLHSSGYGELIEGGASVGGEHRRGGHWRRCSEAARPRPATTT